MPTVLVYSRLLPLERFSDSREGITHRPGSSGNGMPDAPHNCAGTVTHGPRHLLHSMTDAFNHTRSDLVDAPGGL